MSLAFIIYLIETITEIKIFALFAALGILFWMIGFIISLFASSTKEGDYNYTSAQQFLTTYKSLWGFKLMTILFILWSVFIPSKETAYHMLAAYGAEKVITSLAENEKVQSIATESLIMIETAIKTYNQQKATPTKTEEAK